jgi:hypothetical protein
MKVYSSKSDISAIMKKKRDDLKLEVFTEYSKLVSNKKIPCCACCLLNDHIDFLSIEHIDGKTSRSSGQKNLTGPQLNSWLKRNNFPNTFHILCHNCNHTKESFGTCPHQR